MYATRAVQFHPRGSQFDIVWLPARTPHGGERHTGVIRTCGEPDEIKKNTHPEDITPLARAQVFILVGVPRIRIRLGADHSTDAIRFDRINI